MVALQILVLSVQVRVLVGQQKCGCGGIGRPARLRIWFLRECEFESHQPHQCLEKNKNMHLWQSGQMQRSAKPYNR